MLWVFLCFYFLSKVSFCEFNNEFLMKFFFFNRGFLSTSGLCCGLNVKCTHMDSYVWMLGPHLVVIFWKVVESLGDEALLKEVGHWQLLRASRKVQWVCSLANPELQVPNEDEVTGLLLSTGWCAQKVHIPPGRVNSAVNLGDRQERGQILRRLAQPNDNNQRKGLLKPRKKNVFNFKMNTWELTVYSLRSK